MEEVNHLLTRRITQRRIGGRRGLSGRVDSLSRGRTTGTGRRDEQRRELGGIANVDRTEALILLKRNSWEIVTLGSRKREFFLGRKKLRSRYRTKY